MDLYGQTGGDEKKPLKSSSKACNPGAADCTDGQRPSTKRARMKPRAFSTTKSRYNLPQGKKKKEEPIPEGGTHMNMRDLAADPGQPTTHMDRNTNTEERKKSELVLNKNRKFFKKK